MLDRIIIVVVGIVIALGIGATVGYNYLANKTIGFVELHNTRAGTFILLQDKIYTVSELRTDEVQTGTLSRR
jgi:hypothetical protein